MFALMHMPVYKNPLYGCSSCISAVLVQTALKKLIRKDLGPTSGIFIVRNVGRGQQKTGKNQIFQNPILTKEKVSGTEEQDV